MRILHVINSLGTGGAEKLLLETIPLYRQKVIEMDILVLWDDDFAFLNTLKKLHCCKIFILNKSKNYKDIYNPLNIVKLRKYIKAYDIIHVHLFPAQYFAALANIGLNKKLIFTEHNTTNRRIQNKVFKPLERSCYAQYAALICISDQIKDIYEKYVRSRKTIVIHNGINLQTILGASSISRNSLDPRIGDDDILILQVSAFRAQKDQDSLIRSLKLLPISYKLLLVGDGDRRKELEQIVENEDLLDRVLFLGQRMDVANILKSVDIVCLSSHYEGLSLASVEGLASGKPFIASDVPGLRDVVKGAGILFERGNSKELADKILEVMDNEVYRNDIISKSLERAKQYDIQHMVDAHIELYRKVYDEI